MTKKPARKTASRLGCSICGNIFSNIRVLDRHIPDCFVANALDEVMTVRCQEGSSLDAITRMGQDARSFIFALKYKASGENERAEMYVCSHCHALASDDSLRLSCSSCGSEGTIQRAEEFVEELYEEFTKTPRLN